MTKDQDGK